MNINEIEDRMILALEGDLSDADFRQLMLEIEADEKLSIIWKSYQDLYQDLDSTPLDVPSDRVRDGFYNWLETQSEEKPKIVDIVPQNVKKGPIILWRRWAGVAAVLICVFGFWTMYQQNQHVENTLADVTKQMEVLMAEKSSTERIKAIRVNYSPELGEVDENMIQVLIEVLNKDESSNVRLAAVETLARYIDQVKVREALIKRLADERDGGVKISIITTLGQQQDENLKTTLENIVNDDSQEKFIIDEAHMQLIRFEKIDI